jgi:hypothetical protein
MCRKKPSEFEDFAQEEEDEEHEEEENEEEEEEEEDNTIYLSRLAIDAIIRYKGGLGLNATLETEVGFDEIGYATIARSEFERITHAQGCTPFSDAHWNQLKTIYPVDAGSLAATLAHA